MLTFDLSLSKKYFFFFLFLINISDWDSRKYKNNFKIGSKFSINFKKNHWKRHNQLISEIECQLKYSNNKSSKEKKDNYYRNRLNNILQNYLYIKLNNHLLH